jgi:hypothetical protein
MASDNAKPRATAPPPRLDWQGELDSAMADIDDRLINPRRRAADGNRQPVLPELGSIPVTTELLDEIAWRVAEQIRRSDAALPAPAPAPAPDEAMTTAAAPAPPRIAPAPPRPVEREECELRPGKIVMIRYKLPLLPWPFRLLQRRSRKKQHPLTTARLRA